MKPKHFGCQNMTEGSLTDAIRQADAFVGQEIPKKGLRMAFKQADMKVFLPVRDRNQCIAWDPDVFKITQTGWEEFHRSGDAENWDINTPARGLIWAKGTFVERPHQKVAIGGLWILNSWGKPGERRRREIVEETTLPVIREWVRKMHAQDRFVMLAGDANNVRWGGQLPGLTQIFTKGLDRMWVSTHGPLHVRPGAKADTWHGPKTGVGPDLKHESINATLRVKR